jgi:hypothetical protein
MSTKADAARRLRAEIAAAFSGHPYPGDNNLVDAGTLDPKTERLRNAFKNRRWQDVSIDMVRSFKDDLPLFTPAAFAYFLPAYLLACMEAPDEVDTAFDSVIFNLTPPLSDGGWQIRFFQARARLFSQEEANTLSMFLDMAARHEIDEWASEGGVPPFDRIGRARGYWASIARGKA